ADKDKTEVLKEKLRRALGVKIEETRQVYEGKVEEVDIQQGSGGMNPMQRKAAEASVTLSTKDESKTLRLGRNVATSLQNEGVREGDVVRIDSDSGKVNRLGNARDEWEGTADESVADLVDVPTGEVEKERDFTHTLTLHHMDQANARRGGGLMSAFGMGESGISEDIRNGVDKKVKEMIEQDKAELVPGVLFIDEVHMLDIEAISFLNRAMEKEFSPIIVLASNRGKSTIRGTDIEAPYGLPLDLLDRLLIINTGQYEKKDVEEIVKIRAEEEEVELGDDALGLLSEIGQETSMRYAVQLLAPASNISEKLGEEKVEEKHVEEAKEHFSDLEKSADLLQEYEDDMLS
ncbi:MAG: RuvB-like domain-containing protein, partial [Candidatus Nanohaloarchaeota archaeon QJJ-9]|nr:RuvB-like domain-containing protein [Candidatus Nanohaloarchaeota archaeon QJJ-9]